MSKFFRVINEEANRLGYDFIGTGKHHKFRHRTTHKLVVVSATASDHRAMMNIRQDLKRNAKV